MMSSKLQSLCAALEEIVTSTSEVEIPTIGVKKLDDCIKLSTGEYLKNSKGILKWQTKLFSYLLYHVCRY